MAKSARLLIIDADPASIEEMGRVFAREDYYLVTCRDGEQAADLANSEAFDAVVGDYESCGPLLLPTFRKKHSRLPVIIMSGDPGSRVAIESIKAGAYDFLAKPAEPEELRHSVAEAIAASRRMSTTVGIGGGENHSSGEGDALIGRSRAMLEVYKALGRISPTPVTVLIRGETGTGKELVARALYQHGHRAHKPFITVNCAAIPENLLESELFGHEKGAFTGAVATRIGKFEQAHDATLFLDEIGDLDLSLQAKLLRVLQEKRIQRVGAREDIPVDVRIIAATHRDLEHMFADGDFREDLFYRLNVATITLPPLRDRREDISSMVDYFLKRFGRELNIARPAITTRALRYLEEQPWPGNVRQLQNVIRKALLKSRGYAVDVSDFQDIVRESESSGISGGGTGPRAEDSLTEIAGEALRRAGSGEIEAAYPEVLAKMESALFDEAMRLSRGNQARAARWLGISRLTLRQKLRKYGRKSG